MHLVNRGTQTAVPASLSLADTQFKPMHSGKLRSATSASAAEAAGTGAGAAVPAAAAAVLPRLCLPERLFPDEVTASLEAICFRFSLPLSPSVFSSLSCLVSLSRMRTHPALQLCSFTRRQHLSAAAAAAAPCDFRRELALALPQQLVPLGNRDNSIK